MRIIVAVILLCVVLPARAALPGFNDVRALHVGSDVLLFDRHGAPLHEIRVDPKRRHLEWTALADISPRLIQAVVQAEDKRFYDHHGVDWYALGKSALRGGARGASTLSMQLASRLEPALAPAQGRRSVGQKWDQIGAARELERAWTKQQIIEAYLNLVDFRGELRGVAAAARGLFDKHPSGLSESEALLLAALLRAPTASVDVVASRACALNAKLDWSPSCDAVTALARTRLSGPFALRAQIAEAPHVARLVVKQDELVSARRINTTLDAALQRFAHAAARRQVQLLSDGNAKEAALLVADNLSGEVLAYVGNVGGSYVDGVRALRQAGSTLKPILYATAFERRLLTAASVLDDSPVNLQTPTGFYTPQNYDKDFKGPVSVRTALAASLNIPAVRTLMLLGADNFVSQLRHFGFADITESGDYYGYALALGSAEVNLWQLVNAYRTLANGGAQSPMTLIPRGAAPARRVLDRNAAFIVADVLSDRSARSLAFGLENVLATRYWSAVKTGTSKDMRDNWCVGFSTRYTVGVWVGNFNGEPMKDVSGVSGAAPLWMEVMNYLHAGIPNRRPAAPKGIVRTRVRYAPAIEVTRDEWFLRGTEAREIRVVGGGARHAVRVVYPRSGAILALDPDVPLAAQRIFFEASSDAGARFVVDNIPLTDVKGGWPPTPGTHRLRLLDESGNVADEITFEVRGVEPAY